MTARVRLRPTMTSDIPYVVSLERDPVNLPFITPWDKPQHEGAIRFADMRHFIIEAVGGPAGLDAIGFAILIGCRNPHHSLELKRIVVAHKGEGYGRAAVRVLKKIAFDELGAHRFWLDVKSRNARAQGLYASEGFVVEGTLRDAVLTSDGRESLVVMSMLHKEFAQRRAAHLEALL
jgi:diamine N-acetyltransferase